MSGFFGRMAAAYKNTMHQGCSELLGIAEGLLCDRPLTDEKIRFLDQWLKRHEAVAAEWPGDRLKAEVTGILADGIITEAERAQLVETLRKLHGGALDDLASTAPVNQLAFDEGVTVGFPEKIFCLTGDFVLGPRKRCEETVQSRGGIVWPSITRKLNYLVVGGLGSPEWKHGGYGLKIKKAIDYKQQGRPILIVHEADFTRCL